MSAEKSEVVVDVDGETDHKENDLNLDFDDRNAGLHVGLDVPQIAPHIMGLPVMSEKMKIAEDIRPWAEFLRGKRLGCPTTLNNYRTRFNTNISYFTYNYMLILPAIIFICMLTPMTVIMLALMGITTVTYRACAKSSDRKHAVIIAVFIPVVMMCVLAPSIDIFIFVGITAVVVVIHATLYKIEDNYTRGFPLSSCGCNESA